MSGGGDAEGLPDEAIQLQLTVECDTYGSSIFSRRTVARNTQN